LEIFKINRGANPAKLFETHFQKHFLWKYAQTDDVTSKFTNGVKVFNEIS
jgi:hypothetical protein